MLTQLKIRKNYRGSNLAFANVGIHRAMKWSTLYYICMYVYLFKSYFVVEASPCNCIPERFVADLAVWVLTKYVHVSNKSIAYNSISIHRSTTHIINWQMVKAREQRQRRIQTELGSNWSNISWPTNWLAVYHPILMLRFEKLRKMCTANLCIAPFGCPWRSTHCLFRSATNIRFRELSYYLQCVQTSTGNGFLLFAQSKCLVFIRCG